jgi:penicillin G amidase
MRKFGLLALLVSLLLGCPTVEEPPPNPLEVVAQTGSWTLPCLTAEVHVVRTEHDVPHIYAANDADLACAQGFVTARDRFFQMDLISRAGLGTLSELLGEEGLSTDIETRSRAGMQIAQQMVDHATPEQTAIFQAFADGVNAYIAQVRSGAMAAPAEIEMMYTLLGHAGPADMMFDWSPLSIGGAASMVNFVSGFETTDIGWQSKTEQLEAYGWDKPKGELRHAGAELDIWNNITPVYPVDSSGGFVSPDARSFGEPTPVLRSGPKVEAGVLARAVALSERMDERRFGRVLDEPWGSNSWAVGPELTASGNAIVAGDGHLALTSPAFLYHTHLDTQLLGAGDMHMIGLTVAGSPMIGLGTNGDVAWAHTSQTGDINDYYRDEVVLGADGRPSATVFQGDEVPVQSIVESYLVDDALGSTAGTREIERWLTGQKRPFFSLEGTEVDSQEDDAAAVNIFGDWIVAGDVDGDGVITAITGAASHFNEAHMIEHVQGWAKAADVDEWHHHLQGMTSYSQHFIVGDTSGNILYTGFQGMPCRGYLPRDPDGVPVVGANPQLLIDGTLYPSFEVTYGADRRIDPAQDDELRCTYTPEQYPHGRNPEQGFITNSNNDPSSAAFDNNLWNDPFYLGGPYAGTYRGSRITELIQQDAGSHTVESMAAIQGDHKSRYATEFLVVLLDAIDLGIAYAADGEVDPMTVEGRMATMYVDHSGAIDEARGRLLDWQARGLIAHSGVETWYSQPTADEVEDSIATMIWNAWFPRWANSIFDDEGLPGLFRPYGMYGKTRTLKGIVDGVGPAGAALASMDPDTGESVFVDDLNTPDITESMHELALRELTSALDYLATPFGGDRSGGFNTDDQSQWKWGLKHFVSFDSFIASEIGGDELIGSVFSDMNITPEVLPLMDEEFPYGDPRRGLPGFPRPCDAACIDAAGGMSTTNYGYGSGPVMRMVIELRPDGVHGVNVIPGGQAADPDSPFFADQAALWIANEASPVRFYVDDVIAGATGREVLSP